MLRPQLGDALAILSNGDLLQAYGARDPWDLVDHLSRLELGGTRDTDRHQTLAAAGTIIVGWLSSDDGAVTEEVAGAARTWLAAATRAPDS